MLNYTQVTSTSSVMKSEGEKETNRNRVMGRDRQTEIGGETHRENSELYYTRLKILCSCPFLQSAHANLHTNRERDQRDLLLKAPE